MKQLFQIYLIIKIAYNYNILTKLFDQAIISKINPFVHLYLR